MRCWRRIIALATLVLASACGAPAGSVSSLDRLEIDLRIDAAGAAHVDERIVADVPSSGAIVSRQVSGDHAAAAHFRASSVDGRSLEPGGDGDVTLAVDANGGMNAVWAFAPGAAGARVITFSYQLDDTLAVRGRRGSLRRALLAPNRSYAVREAHVRASVPDGAHVFDGTGIAESGWEVAWTERGIAATRRDVGADEAATLVVELDVDPAIVAEPAWQRDAEATRLLVPAFISGGLFIVTIGAGVLWIIRFQYPRRRADGTDERDRSVVRAGLRTTGIVSMVIAVILAGVTGFTLSRFGYWPQILPLSVFAVGGVFVVVSRRIV